MVSKYFLLFIDAGRGDVAARVSGHGFSNAKALVFATVANELIVRIEGNEAHDVTLAGRQLLEIEGVSRASELSSERTDRAAARERLEAARSRCQSVFATISSSATHSELDQRRVTFLQSAMATIESALRGLDGAAYEKAMSEVASRLDGPLQALLGSWGPATTPDADQDDADVAEMAGHAAARVTSALEDLEKLHHNI